MVEASRGAVSEELLDSDNIQGNILAGFNKDHQVFLFMQMARDVRGIAGVRAWLRTIAAQISSTAEVHRFNDLFKALKIRQGRDPVGLIATWVNIAFSAGALKALTSPEDVEKFTDAPFLDGLAVWSGELGDPSDANAEGHPKRWVVGGPQNEADIVLIVASDSAAILAERVMQLKATLTNTAEPKSGVALESALRVVWEQPGQTLPPPLVGHEHFGFKDGISQPGIRGYVRAAPEKLVTPRLIDPTRAPQQEPKSPEFAKPGQPLIWPGQFIFGYRRQDPNDPRRPPLAPNELMMNCPAWAHDGSFLVVRRLRQDVAAFRTIVAAEAQRLAGSNPVLAGMTPELLAAKLVGRWPSGAPVMRARTKEDTELGADDKANNYFGFANDSGPPLPIRPEEGYAGDGFALSVQDDPGVTCPLSAHIRKVNPRDSISEQGNTHDALTRMVLRRGIPFGPPYMGDVEARAGKGGCSSQRGLIFVCYQTSIEKQFVFLQRNWANHASNPNGGGGEDPLIGQGTDEAQRQRFVDIPAEGEVSETLVLPGDFVIPTGGGFFFSPSISTITNVLARS